jgi:hypothetical protein
MVAELMAMVVELLAMVVELLEVDQYEALL